MAGGPGARVGPGGGGAEQVKLTNQKTAFCVSVLSPEEEEDAGVITAET